MSDKNYTVYVFGIRPVIEDLGFELEYERDEEVRLIPETTNELDFWVQVNGSQITMRSPYLDDLDPDNLERYQTGERLDILENDWIEKEVADNSLGINFDIETYLDSEAFNYEDLPENIQRAYNGLSESVANYLEGGRKDSWLEENWY